jgi:hypothetical protein
MEPLFSPPGGPSGASPEPGFLWAEDRDGRVRVRLGHPALPPGLRKLVAQARAEDPPLGLHAHNLPLAQPATHALRAAGLRPPGSPGRPRRVGNCPARAQEAVTAGRRPERGDRFCGDGVGGGSATSGEGAGQECVPWLVPVCCVGGRFPAKGDFPGWRWVPGGPGDRGVAKERCVRGPLRWGQLLGVLLGRRRSSRRRVGLSLFGARISVTLA